MEIIFNSGGITSHVQKSTRIVSNDSVDSVTWVWISVDGIPKSDSNLSLQISPNVLDFTSIDLSKTPEKEVKIKNITTSDLGIKIVDMPDELMNVKLSDKMIKPSEEVELKVKLKREAENIKFTKSITFELSDPDSSRFTVPVTSGNLSSKH